MSPHTTAPQALDHAGIAARIPHAGRMCLLDALLGWSPERIRCRSTSHHASDHPLRSASGLLAPAAIEIAAQAMALHGALIAPSGSTPTPGYLASVRDVRLAVPTLDGIAGALVVAAERLAGDQRQILYRFDVRDEAGGAVAEGRATVVLNVLPAP